MEGFNYIKTGNYSHSCSYSTVPLNCNSSFTGKAANSNSNPTGDPSHDRYPHMSSTTTPAPNQGRQSPIKSRTDYTKQHLSMDNQSQIRETLHIFSTKHSSIANNTGNLSNETEDSRQAKKENVEPHHMHQTPKTHTGSKPQSRMEIDRDDHVLPLPVVASRVCAEDERLHQQGFNYMNPSDLQKQKTQTQYKSVENTTLTTNNEEKDEELTFVKTTSALSTQILYPSSSQIHNEYTLMPQINPNRMLTMEHTKPANTNQNIIKNNEVTNYQRRKNIVKNNNGTNVHSVMVKDAKAIFEGKIPKKDTEPKVPPKLPPRTFFGNKSQVPSHEDIESDQPPKLPPRKNQASTIDFYSCDEDTRVNNIEEYVTIYDYIAQSKDDLTVTRGELVYTNAQTTSANKDWVWVYSVKSKRYGYVPRSYIKTPLQTAL